MFPLAAAMRVALLRSGGATVACSFDRFQFNFQVLVVDLTYTELQLEHCTPSCSGDATRPWPAAAIAVRCYIQGCPGSGPQAA